MFDEKRHGHEDILRFLWWNVQPKPIVIAVKWRRSIDVKTQETAGSGWW